MLAAVCSSKRAMAAGVAAGVAATTSLACNVASAKSTTPHPMVGAYELQSTWNYGVIADPASKARLSDEQKARVLGRYGDPANDSLRTLRTYMTSSSGAAAMCHKPPMRPAQQAGDATGLLVYLRDGRMWTQVQVAHEGSQPTYTGYSGRWWLHQGSAAGNPPHGNQPLVEHHVKASSDPQLVGKTVYQQYSLSQNGKHLTTTDVRIVSGKPQVVEVLEWRRLES